MLVRWTLKQGLMLWGTMLVIGIQTSGEAVGITGCRQPTPPPCAADGTCHPNSTEWGYSHTRWRPWPGEPAARRPTTEGERPAPGEGLELDPSLLPSPEEEDLRGVAKKKKPKSEEDADAAEEGDPLPGDDLLPELESGEFEGEVFPEFDPQGNQPSLEDTPPALPQSLQQMARTGSALPKSSSRHQTTEPTAAPTPRYQPNRARSVNL